MRTRTLLGLLILSICFTTRAQSTAPATQTIDVQVLDSNGAKPIPGATVSMWDDKYPPGEKVDASGHAKIGFDRASKFVSLLIRAAGYTPLDVTWDRNEKLVPVPATYVAKLNKGVTIGGRVVSPTSQPVAGATVHLGYRSESSRKDVPEVAEYIRGETIKTNDKGEWRYDAAPAGKTGKVMVRVTDPDYLSDSQSGTMPSAALEKQTAVTVLETGLPLSGVVTTAEGKPIASARVSTIRTVYVVNDYGLTTKSDASGGFKLNPLRPGPITVTVTAKGFAPEMQQVELSKDTKPLKIALNPGKTLRARVVDPSGKPIVGANVMLREWRNECSVDFRADTDKDGRFVMHDAPADPIQFSIGADGYRYKFREFITAADDEAVVKMSPDLHVHGTVVDAATHKPIEKFNVVSGVALWKTRPPLFSHDDPKTFTGGKYDLAVESTDEAIAGYVRIEADGYKPAVSGPITDGKAEFDAQLARGEDVAGTLKDPHGKPLANTTVYLILPGAQVNLYQGQVERSDAMQTKTDANGRYRFGPQIGTIDLFAVADDGYVRVVTSGEHPQTDLTLSPWARIEGIYNPHGSSKKEELLIGAAGPVDPRSPEPKYIWQSIVTTDAKGHYSLSRVPHFDGAPCILCIGVSALDREEERWLPAHLHPGETTRIDVTDDQRAVVGHVAPATKNDEVPGRKGFVLLTPVVQQPPAMWSEDLRAAFEQAHPVYRSSVNPDGTFNIPDVPAGAYEYSLTIYGGEIWSQASGKFDLPPGSPGEAFDIGTIKYVRPNLYKLGEVVPDDFGSTMDGKPLHASEFKGKYVLVVLWSSCSGDLDELPVLDQTAKKLASDDRVALVSINADAVSCGMLGVPRRPASLNDPSWVKGCISLSQESVQTQFNSKQWPTIAIINPDGKLIAKDLKATDVEHTLREELQKTSH